MTYSAEFKIAVAAATAAIAVLASYPARAMPKDPATNGVQTQTPASVLALNQKLKGSAIKITYVYLPESGYVAVFADENGKRTDKVLGFTALDKGNHNDINVKIGDGVNPGAALWASLYKDVDGDKVLDLSKDAALWPNGDPLENQFLIE